MGNKTFIKKVFFPFCKKEPNGILERRNIQFLKLKIQSTSPTADQAHGGESSKLCDGTTETTQPKLLENLGGKDPRLGKGGARPRG